MKNSIFDLVACSALALTVASFGAYRAEAQNFEQIAPNAPPANPRLDTLPSTPAPSAPDRAAVTIIPMVKGIVLVDAPGKIVPTGLDTSGVQTNGIVLLEDQGIKNTLSAYLGKPMTLAGLDQVVRDLVNWYREHDHPLVDVVVPEQSLELQTLQLVVTEFRVGKVAVEGAQWFDPKDIAAGIRVKPGETVDGEALLDDINWLNTNPFRRVDLVYRPGTDAGTADILLRTEDRLPFRPFASYDNSGTKSTGRNRWGIGFNWGDAFWQGHQMSYQFTTSDDFWHNKPLVPGTPDKPSFVAHALSYAVPLPWRDTVSVFGTYAESVPHDTGFFNLAGVSGQASLRYDLTLPRIGNFIESLQFGYDFKSTNNDLAFGGVRLQTTVAEIDQFPIAYNAAMRDAWGETSGGVSVVWSPGGLSVENNNRAFDSNRAGATASYVYGNLRLNRSFTLPYSLELAHRFVWQWSQNTLLPSEQLGGGGATTVRGYDERIANGDDGVLMSTELRLPAWQVIGGDINDQTRFYTFWDFAALHNKIDAAGEARSAHLSSLGVGVQIGLADNLSMRCDYGWQMRRAPGVSDKGEFGHVAIVVAY